MAGVKSGDISFATNDPDETPFNFRITGTVNAVTANLALGRPAVASTSYSGLPASNATDGNAGSRWSSQFSDNEWIYVDLGSVYTINRVVLRWEAALRPWATSSRSRTMPPRGRTCTVRRPAMGAWTTSR